ncbi:helix-turn-helix domain-containing protein [Flavobacteriaceae bacterium R38]|nr:helix-turn-helix domain-containing protein [Flavobacteriaceae bacterium R38]
MSTRIVIVLVLSILCSQTVKPQNDNSIDSLTAKSYEYLYSKISDFYRAPSLGTIYAKAYLDKGLKNNDSVRITKGFYYLSEINSKTYSVSLDYINKAILYDNKSSSITPYIYNQKGSLFHINGKYKNALDNYLEARKQVVHFNLPDLFIKIDYNIGLVRLRIKDFDNALKAFKKNYQYIIENDLQQKKKINYLNSLRVLSIAYLYKNELDSASYFNQLMIEKSKDSINDNDYNYSVSRIFQAYINYEKGNYSKTIDSISKYIKKGTKDSVNLALSYLYLGKSSYHLKKEEEALKQFKKIDTIVLNTKKYIWEIEENYEILRDYYQQKGDLENQLIYLEKLVNFKTNLYNNDSYLKNTLAHKYDIPELIAEKETLISRLQKNDRKKANTVYLLLIFIAGLILLSYYFYRKRIIDKKQFEVLLQKKENHLDDSMLKVTKKELTIPEDIVSNILKKIIVFEEQKEFLDSSITLESLAKKIKTNSNYLSRTINYHKNKNFSTYLSDLRINYTLDLLKKEPKFRNYTIKAIAFEVGFKNSKSFTNAFYKETKLYPSYFIKELQKREFTGVDS